MPYRVLRTIKLSGTLARSPGDIFTQDDIDEIPEKIRARRVQGLLDKGRIIWEDDPVQKLKDAKTLVKAAKEIEKEEKDKNKKKPGRPPKENKEETVVIDDKNTASTVTDANTPVTPTEGKGD